MTLLTKSITAIKYCSIVGVCTGISTSLWLNMNVKISYINGNRKSMQRIPLPIFMGCFFGLALPLSIIITPFGIINYITNSSLIDNIYDKTIQNIENKYNISYERYHQFGSSNTRYDYPSHIIVNIKRINLK